MKKVISLFIAIIMIFTSVPFVFAGEVKTGKCGDNAEYTLDPAGKLTISGTGSIYGDENNVSPFRDNVDIKSAEVKEGITAIGGDAFQGCTALESIKLPVSLQELGGGAFSYCYSLSSIEIPYSVKILWPRTFSGCHSLSEVKLNEGLEEIYCDTFDGCVSLDKINIPSTVNYIGGIAFVGCYNIRHLSVDASSPYFVYEDGVLYSKDKSKLIYINPRNPETTYKAPASVKEVGKYVGYDLINIEKIDLSATSITDLAYHSFAENANLTEIKLPTTLKSVDDEFAVNDKNLKKINIPAELEFSGILDINTGSLEEIDLSSSNENYIMQDGILMDKAKTCIIAIPNKTQKKSITIPKEHAKHIGLINYETLEEIKTEEGCVNFTAKDGVLYNKDMTKMLLYPKGKKDKSFTVPSSVTKAYLKIDNPYLEEIIVEPGSATFASVDGVLFSKDKNTLICYPENKQDTTFTLPAETKNIRNDIRNKNLEEILVDEGNQNFISENGILYDKDKKGISCYPSEKKDTSYVLPDSITWTPEINNPYLNEIQTKNNSVFFSKNGLLYKKDEYDSIPVLVFYPATKTDKTFTVTEKIKINLSVFNNNPYIKEVVVENPQCNFNNDNYNINKDIKFSAPEKSITESNLLANNIKCSLIFDTPLKYVETKEATCTAQGCKGYYVSSNNIYYKDSEGKEEIRKSDTVIPAAGHKFDRKDTSRKYLKSPATFTSAAVYYYSCSGCGAIGTETFTYGNPLKMGDIDNNGDINAADAREVLRASVSLRTLTSEEFKVADVDDSKDVTSADARIILRASVNLETIK